MRLREQLIGLLTVTWTGVVLYWTSTFNLDMNYDAIAEPTASPTEERIVQKLPPPKVRFTVEQEIEMACAEADCVRKCNTLHPDKKTLHDICKRACSKERCKVRCKNEPNPTYVEREMKREKCLDKCSEKDEKCKKFCEEESRRCKDRCKERAQRYFCVRDLDKLGQDDEDEFDPAKIAEDTDVI